MNFISKLFKKKEEETEVVSKGSVEEFVTLIRVYYQAVMAVQLGITPVPLGFAEFHEEISCADDAFDIFAGGFYMVAESVVCIILDSFHEFIREEDGNVHRRQLFFILFDMQEFIDVRMIAVQSDHHSASSAVLADDFASHVENLHEGNSACRSSCNVSYFTALWTKAGNVDADAAAVRENAGDLVVGLEDRFQIILRRRKDIAVGKGNFELALGACSIESAACRTEGSFFQISSHSWTQVIIKNRTDAVHELFRVCFTLVIILLSLYACLAKLPVSM